MKMSFMIGPRPSSFASVDEFKKAILQGKEMGYAGAEFVLGIPLGFQPGELSDYVASIGMSVANVMTGVNAWDDGLFLSVADADVRKRAVQRLQELVPVAKRLHASMVIGSMQGKSIQEPDLAKGRARILECLKQVAETAEKHDQMIVLEPMNHLESAYGFTLEEVQATIRQIGSRCFKPMLDTFHMNIEESDILNTFRRAGSELGHVHLCETNARHAGAGHLNYEGIFDVLEEIKYSRWVTVKAYREPWQDGALASIKYFRKLGRL
jgi:5-keto-L-gluconate epimerase